MMYKKIRGGKRRLKAIQSWAENNKNLPIEILKSHKRAYIKFQVTPWNDIQITNSKYPQPKGEFKKLFLKALVEIYTSWKQSLEAHNKTYYLKIWIFENQLQKSQVVCCVDDDIAFYNNVFEKDEQSSDRKNRCFLSNLELILPDFKWEKFADNTYIEHDYLGEPKDYKAYKNYLDNKKWFENDVLKKYIRKENEGSDSFYYVIKNDVVWVGERDNNI